MESIIIKCIHIVLSRKCNPDGRMDRRKLLEILGESYHIPKEFRGSIIKELKKQGVILDEDKLNFSIKPLNLSQM